MIFSTYQNLLRINLNAKRAVLLTVIDAVLTIVSVVYFLVFAGMGVRGVMLGQLIAKTVLAVGILSVGFYEYLNPKLMSWVMLKKILAYSYPFFFSSTFLWLINSSDKIMGTQLLASQAEVAYLGLAMQITMPIMILASIISQAYGPYVMSIKHEDDASHTYREILSLVIYASTVISVMLLAVSPFLVDILADETFYPALEIIPLFALATVISIVLTQICLGLNLSQKTMYIAIAMIAGGLVGVLFNLYLQPLLGIKAAGYAQIVAYSVSSLIVYKYSQKFMPIDYDWKWVAGILLILAATIILFALSENLFFQSLHLIYLVIGAAVLIILGIIGESKYAVTKLIAGFYKKRR
jgi:O-antigen/teichoic acid export membrane protein